MTCSIKTVKSLERKSQKAMNSDSRKKTMISYRVCLVIIIAISIGIAVFIVTCQNRRLNDLSEQTAIVSLDSTSTKLIVYKNNDQSQVLKLAKIGIGRASKITGSSLSEIWAINRSVGNDELEILLVDLEIARIVFRYPISEEEFKGNVLDLQAFPGGVAVYSELGMEFILHINELGLAKYTMPPLSNSVISLGATSSGDPLVVDESGRVLCSKNRLGWSETSVSLDFQYYAQILCDGGGVVFLTKSGDVYLLDRLKGSDKDDLALDLRILKDFRAPKSYDTLRVYNGEKLLFYLVKSVRSQNWYIQEYGMNKHWRPRTIDMSGLRSFVVSEEKQTNAEKGISE